MDRKDFEKYILDKLEEIKGVLSEFAADQETFPRICASVGKDSVWAFAFVNDDIHGEKLFDAYRRFDD